MTTRPFNPREIETFTQDPHKPPKPETEPKFPRGHRQVSVTVRSTEDQTICNFDWAPNVDVYFYPANADNMVGAVVVLYAVIQGIPPFEVARATVQDATTTVHLADSRGCDSYEVHAMLANGTNTKTSVLVYERWTRALESGVSNFFSSGGGGGGTNVAAPGARTITFVPGGTADPTVNRVTTWQNAVDAAKAYDGIPVEIVFDDSNETPIQIPAGAWDFGSLVTFVGSCEASATRGGFFGLGFSDEYPAIEVAGTFVTSPVAFRNLLMIGNSVAPIMTSGPPSGPIELDRAILGVRDGTSYLYDASSPLLFFRISNESNLPASHPTGNTVSVRSSGDMRIVMQTTSSAYSGTFDGPYIELEPDGSSSIAAPAGNANLAIIPNGENALGYPGIHDVIGLTASNILQANQGSNAVGPSIDGYVQPMWISVGGVGPWSTAEGFVPYRRRGSTAQRPTHLTAHDPDGGHQYYDTNKLRWVFWESTANFWQDDVGPSAARPAGLFANNAGARYFDTTIGKPIWWSGSQWIKADGTAA